MRQQTIAPENLATGQVAWTHRRRATSYHEGAVFEWVRGQAIERHVGIGVVVAELIEQAFIAKGPHQ